MVRERCLDFAIDQSMHLETGEGELTTKYPSELGVLSHDRRLGLFDSTTEIVLVVQTRLVLPRLRDSFRIELILAVVDTSIMLLDLESSVGESVRQNGREDPAESENGGSEWIGRSVECSRGVTAGGEDSGDPGEGGRDRNGREGKVANE